MNIALLDDDPTFFTVFRHALSEAGIQDKVDCYTDSLQFLKNKVNYDVLFLDVEMSSMSGFDVAEKLREAKSNIIIVFLTSHDETVFNAFGLNVMSFILKDFLKKEIKSVWRRLTNEISRNSSFSFQTDNGRSMTLLINNIEFCETFGRKVRIVDTNNNRYLLKGYSIGTLYNELAEYSFVWINRSCFVNISKIEYVDKESIKMINIKNPLYFSRNRYKTIKEKFIKYHIS